MAETKTVSEKERDLLKSVFKDNEYLLKAVRSLLLGFEVSNEDKKLIISAFKNKELKAAVRNKIFAVMNPDAPIGQLNDFWMGAEAQVMGQNPEVIYQILQAKKGLIAKFNSAMLLLDNPEGGKIDISYNPTEISYSNAVGFGIDLVVRNLYIKAIDTGLMYIKLIAEEKASSVAEVKEKALKNSNK